LLETDKINLILQDKSVEALQILIQSISDKHQLTPDELLGAITSKHDTDDIPLSAFDTNKLSALEIVTKYLKENRNKKNSEIAQLLDRNDRTVWSTYNNANSKHPQALDIQSGLDFIPVFIFRNRKMSVLENLVIYLKDTLNFSFSKISKILKKDYQTIYTTYRRGVSK
jgi:hypothetical protein